MKKSAFASRVCISLLILLSFFFNQINGWSIFVGQCEAAEDVEHNYLADETIDIFTNDSLEGIKCRIDTPDDDLRIVKFLREDGNAEMRIFNDPIKYVSDDGKIHTKSIKLFELSEEEETLFKYSNRFNDVRIQFGKQLESGVSMNYKDYQLMIFPEGNRDSEACITKDGNKIFYEKAFSDLSRIEFVADYSGLKEDIILEGFEGISSFSFVIKTKGIVSESNGKIILTDCDGRCIGSFGDIIISDADCNRTYGESKAEKISETEYLYTVSVPESFLSDPNTVYPVNIDPTFTFDFYTNNFAGYKQIYDVTLQETGYVYQPQSETLTVSTEANIGQKKTIVKFPNLNTILNNIGSDNILYVLYSYQGITNSTNSVSINPMTVNWSHNAVLLTNGTYRALFNGYDSSQTLNSNLHWGPGKIDFTLIAKDWINNVYANYGIMISGSGYNDIASAETSTSYYRPYIDVIYNHEAISSDPFEGLYKFKPYKEDGSISSYAMKNANSVVTTSITNSIYNSTQLLLVTRQINGYTIQNPYTDYYLTSSGSSLSFTSSLSNGSYWSFVDNGTGYYIVGVNSEQLDCASPGTLGSSVGVCTFYNGLTTRQPTCWKLEKQIDRIPFRLRNVSSQKYLTVENAYDYDNKNIFQYSLHTETDANVYNPVFGSQGVRPVYDSGTSSYKLNLICSENGRFRSLAWNSAGNAFEYNPSSTNNKLTFSFLTNGYAIITQKSNPNLALAVTNNSNGSASGTSVSSSGNIVFSSFNSSDSKQKWIFEFDLKQFKKEAYYSSFSLSYVLPNNNDNKKINSDYGPRFLSSLAIHDGLDLYGTMGTNVYAPFSGTVIAIVPSSNGGARGNFVIIESNSIPTLNSSSKVRTVLQHLSSFSSSIYVGQTITAGTLIGYVGASGMSQNIPENAHLHFSLFTGGNASSNGSLFTFPQKQYFIDPLILYNEFSFRKVADNITFELITLN